VCRDLALKFVVVDSKIGFQIGRILCAAKRVAASNLAQRGMSWSRVATSKTVPNYLCSMKTHANKEGNARGLFVTCREKVDVSILGCLKNWDCWFVFVAQPENKSSTNSQCAQSRRIVERVNS
jgi:hypothetical protein